LCSAVLALRYSIRVVRTGNIGANAVISVGVLCWVHSRQEEEHINVAYLRTRISHTDTDIDPVRTRIKIWV
jgi:hypothetical protein